MSLFGGAGPELAILGVEVHDEAGLLSARLIDDPVVPERPRLVELPDALELWVWAQAPALPVRAERVKGPRAAEVELKRSA